jgi:hypothetical protein
MRLRAALVLALGSACVGQKDRAAPPGADADRPAPAATPAAQPPAPSDPDAVDRGTNAAVPARPPPAAGSAAAAGSASARGLPAAVERPARDPFTPDLRPPPAISIGRLTVSGGLLAAPERAVLRMKNGFRACLTETGQLTLDVLVADNGSVLSAKATDIEGLPPSEVDCVERRAAAATFKPPAGGPAHVVFPLVSATAPSER